jgi:hypothetical protein
MRRAVCAGPPRQVMARCPDSGAGVSVPLIAER